MSENQLLVCILILVYLSECIAWVPAQAYAFNFSAPQRGRANLPGKGLGNDRGRIVWAHPIPLLAGLYIVPQNSGNIDATAAEGRWEEFRQRTRGLGIASNSAFFLLFLVVPVIWKWFGTESIPMLVAVALLLIAGICTAFCYAKSHRSLFPESRADLFQQSMLLALVPTHACRARETLGRKLLTAQHPLAVAKLALQQEAFERFASRLQREAHHPLPGSPQVDLTALDAFLAAEGIHPSAPAATEESTQYCPRCHAQFGPEAASCNDCQDMALVKFDNVPR